MVPITDIECEPVREITEPLVESLRTLGFRQTVLLVPSEGLRPYRAIGRTELFWAAQELGLEEVPALIRFGDDEATRARIRLHEQLLAPERSNLDRAWKVDDAVRTLEEAGEASTNRALASEVGSSERTIRRLKRIGSQITPDLVEDLIDQEEFCEEEVHGLPLASLEHVARQAKQVPGFNVVEGLRSALRREDDRTGSAFLELMPTLVRRIVGWVLSVLMPLVSVLRTWLGNRLDPPGPS